jgi:hypothetical protein
MNIRDVDGSEGLNQGHCVGVQPDITHTHRCEEWFFTVVHPVDLARLTSLTSRTTGRCSHIDTSSSNDSNAKSNKESQKSEHDTEGEEELTDK